MLHQHKIASNRAEWQSAFRCLLACAVVVFAPHMAHSADDEGPVLKRVEILTGGPEAVRAESGAGTTVIQSIEINERPLGAVLDYLSRISGVNIRVKKDNVAKFPVSLKLENVTWRAVLDFIVRKYGMILDETMLDKKIILVDTPEKVSMVFHNADIRDVINTIAIQANANVVIGPEVNGQISMRLENVPWLDALNIVVRTLDFVAVPEANTIRITSPTKVAAQLDTRIFRLAYISPEGSKYSATISTEFAKREGAQDTKLAGSSIIDVLNNVKTTTGKFAFDKGSNSLIVRDTSTALDAMQMIINKLDIPPKQVHVAVKLVQLSDTDEEDIGVKWGAGLEFNVTPVSSWSTTFPFDVASGLSKSLLGDLTVATAPIRAVDPVTGAGVAGTDLFSLRHAVAAGNTTALTTFGGGGVLPPNITLGSMGFGNTTALLQLLRNKTSAKVIQAPQLIALENEEATIQVGQLVRYAETIVANTEGGGNVGGFREASGSPLKLGFQLLVIAHVTGPENNILMTIIPKTEDFQGFLTFGTLQLPQTSQSIVVTKMMLRNGETGVIGGLRQENQSLSEIKVPVFSEIPFIGRLFKHRSRNSTASNLLVFVTPTIIDFFETDQMKKDLEKMRTEYAKPLTAVGEEEEKSTTAAGATSGSISPR